MGTLIAAYALFDVVPIAVIVIGLTAWFEQPLLLFAMTAIALVIINVASCRWLQHHWDSWTEGKGERIEAKLATMRTSRVMKHPVGWISRGSDWWFALATVIVNPILVMAAARVVGGKRISERRIMIASIAYAVPMALIFTITGYVVGEALRAS